MTLFQKYLHLNTFIKQIQVKYKLKKEYINLKKLKIKSGLFIIINLIFKPCDKSQIYLKSDCVAAGSDKNSD